MRSFLSARTVNGALVSVIARPGAYARRDTCRERGGFVPRTEDIHRAKWPLGTEARPSSIFCFCGLSDAHRFGPPYLRRIVRKMAIQIATERSPSNTTVTVQLESGKLADGAYGRDPRWKYERPGCSSPHAYDGNVWLEHPEDPDASHRQGERGTRKREWLEHPALHTRKSTPSACGRSRGAGFHLSPAVRFP